MYTVISVLALSALGKDACGGANQKCCGGNGNYSNNACKSGNKINVNSDSRGTVCTCVPMTEAEKNFVPGYHPQGGYHYGAGPGGGGHANSPGYHPQGGYNMPGNYGPAGYANMPGNHMPGNHANDMPGNHGPGNTGSGCVGEGQPGVTCYGNTNSRVYVNNMPGAGTATSYGNSDSVISINNGPPGNYYGPGNQPTAEPTSGASHQGTVELDQGQPCGGATPPGYVKRKCKAPMTCRIDDENDGGFGTCEYPSVAIGTVELKQGEDCGSATKPGGMKRECQHPMTCRPLGENPDGPGYVGTCEYPTVAIGTLELTEGEQCGGAIPPGGMQRACQPPMTCRITGVNPGGFGTCEYPKQVVTSRVGGYCGGFDSPAMRSYQCASGLVCHTTGIPGTYGRCQSPVSGLGGPCGEGYYPRDCLPGLHCRHAKWNGPGTCVQLGDETPGKAPTSG